MHYKNGREAKVGDQIFWRSYGGVPRLGVVVATTSALSKTCNLYVAPVGNTELLTASDCLHVDDLVADARQGYGAPSANAPVEVPPPNRAVEQEYDAATDRKAPQAKSGPLSAGGVAGVAALIMVATLLTALLAGCGTLDSLYTKQVTTVPGTVLRTNTVFQTNVVVVTEARTNVVTVTNAVTGKVTQETDVSPPVLKQVVTPVITYDYAPPTTVTNLVPRAGIEGLIQGGSALPIPFAGTLALGLGWLYSFYASVRNKKVAAGVVMSVERAREFLQTTPEGQRLDEKVKQILAEHQDSAGIITQVNKLLAKYVDAK